MVEDFELPHEPVPPLDFQEHLERADSSIKQAGHDRERFVLATVQQARQKARTRDIERAQGSRMHSFVSDASLRRAQRNRTGKRFQNMEHLNHFEGNLSRYVQLDGALHAVVESDKEFAITPVDDHSRKPGSRVVITGRGQSRTLSAITERGGHER
jgi:hypothetical protein